MKPSKVVDWRQAEGRTAFCAASEVGPAREGIQKKPAVNKPSSATFERALHTENQRISAAHEQEP